MVVWELDELMDAMYPQNGGHVIVKWLLFIKTFEILLGASTNTDKYYFIDNEM